MSEPKVIGLVGHFTSFEHEARKRGANGYVGHVVNLEGGARLVHLGKTEHVRGWRFDEVDKIHPFEVVEYVRVYDLACGRLKRAR